jgi:hypothetical protein
MLGNHGLSYHFEFTYCRAHPVTPTPTPEDLIIIYLPESENWRRTCSLMLEAGFVEVRSFNPYWQQRGRTFKDHDGYRTVLEHASWSSGEGALT